MCVFSTLNVTLQSNADWRCWGQRSYGAFERDNYYYFFHKCKVTHKPYTHISI